jgi:trans-aconitate methyltransferase
MLAEARNTLARWQHQVTFVQADLLELDHILDADERVQVIFSTAVFHWIANHERLFAALPDSLRDDFVGQVVDEIIHRQGCTLDYVRLNLGAFV